MVTIQFIHPQTLEIEFSSLWKKSVYKPFFYKELNQLKQVKTLDILKKRIEEIEWTRGKQYAFDLLSRRSYTTKGLTRKLYSRHLSSPIIARIIEKCLQLGYIDDEETILLAIRSELKKGYGPSILVSKLAFKLNYLRSEVEAILQSKISQEEIELHRQNYLQTIRHLEKRRQMQRLYQRGFNRD